ncbi:MAG TPA: hypothetical protein VM753_12305 [Anaeromyxobacter sp.]|nr:hypothetical protein [Anaeromyxobacter sp.]
MTLHVALALSALAASVLLLLFSQQRTLAIVALLASGVEVAIQLGLVHLSISRVPLGLVLGLGLAVPGLFAWFRATAKGAVSAAALVAFTGLLQVLAHVGGRF